MHFTFIALCLVRFGSVRFRLVWFGAVEIIRMKIQIKDNSKWEKETRKWEKMEKKYRNRSHELKLMNANDAKRIINVNTYFIISFSMRCNAMQYDAFTIGFHWIYDVFTSHKDNFTCHTKLETIILSEYPMWNGSINKISNHRFRYCFFFLFCLVLQCFLAYFFSRCIWRFCFYFFYFFFSIFCSCASVTSTLMLTLTFIP